MRKLLALGTGVALLLPVFSFAAFNDVSLTTDTVFTVNGFTVNVSGATAVVESITVNPTNFSFTLLSGSSIRVTAPGGNRLSADSSTGQNSNICTNSESSLGYAADSTVTVTVEVSGSICSAGGGGGGGSTNYTIITTAPTTTTATSTAAVATTTATTSAPTVPTIASLQAQLAGLLAQLQALKGGATPNANAYANASANASFKRNLEMGFRGDDVKALQVYLNTHGYAVASSGPGSLGNETTSFRGLTRAALVKLQKAAGIKPAAGYLGPKTRAYIAANP